MLFRSKKISLLILADLECLPCSTMMDMFSEPNEALSHWYSLFKSVLVSHATLKKRHVKREFIPEWFNSEIQAAIATRNHLHRKAVMTNNASNWCEYRSARNRVVDLIVIMLSALSTETQLTIILKILKTSGALFVLLRPLNVLNYQIIQPLTVGTIMIIMILQAFLTSILLIFLPPFS